MRYLALTDEDRKQMLKTINATSVDEIFSQSGISSTTFDLPKHKSEIEVQDLLTNLAKKNRSAGEGPFFLGAGCYRHHIPASVDHLIQRSEFLTSYTPYQPEISQGTLATIFQFQSIISLLTGMEVANASMYDGATSLAEACMMALRIKTDKPKIAFANSIHPDYRECVDTYMELCHTQIVDHVDRNCAAVVVQYPDFYGNIPNLNKIRQECDANEALMIVCVNEIVSLGLLEAPSMADIVIGEAASIGVGMNFGGPVLGFFACKQEYLRQMPGRICGQTTDEDGKPGYVLTLNAREQHIRREKATSNICSNQGLCATAFTIHASLLGEIGFKKLALLNHEKACKLADKISQISGIKILNDTFFNEFTIELPSNAEAINKKLLAKGIIGGVCQENKMIIAVTELTADEHMDAFVNAIKASI